MSLILVKVILLALAVNVIVVLFDKWNIIAVMQIKAPNKFFRKMFTCEFCMNHHYGVIILAIFGIFGGYDLIDLGIPILSASLINMVKK